MMRTKVIFDCDNTMGQIGWELDDGLALFYILGSSDFELLGITTTFGNGKIENVMRYTKNLLKVIGREDIPLKEGASRRGAAPTEAAHFLAENAASNPGEIVILAVGTLGNLQAAAQIDPNFFRNLKAIILMGGHIEHPFTMGNLILPDVNLRRDPKATFRVFHAECPVTVINSEICKQVPFTKEHLERVNFWPNNIRHLIESLFSTYNEHTGLDLIYIWDVLVPVFLNHSDLFDKNQVRIIASNVKDIKEGHLKLTDKENGVLINMPSKILDPNLFMNIVIEAWLRLHNITMEKNKGYLDF